MKIKRTILQKDNGRSPLKRPPLRQAGQSDAQKIGYLNAQIILFIFVGIIFALFAYSEWLNYLFKTPPQPILWTCLALIVIAGCCYIIYRLLTERNNWELGRQGEIEVGNFLEELRAKGYEIFHDIQCEENGNTFNVDHLIVSPNGIYAIETKTPRKRLSRSNRIDFDGQSTIKISGRSPDRTIVPEAISKARWISDNVLPKRGDHKKYNVTSIIVYPDWSVNGNQIGKDAWVINPKQLQWVIPNQQVSLTPEEISSVTQVLRAQNR